MQDFFTTLLTFPAVIPSILLAVILLYWLFVILGALDIDAFGDIDIGDFFHHAGIVGMPFGMIISILIFIFWVLVVPLTQYIVLLLPWFYWQLVTGSVILIGSFWLSMYLTLWTIRPLQHLLHNSEKLIHHRDLLGSTCLITTSRVDEKFGQAEYDDGGAGLIINVYADTPNTLSRHDTALIIEYNADTQSYTVAAYHEN
jgi:hypothetical protein